MVRLLDFTTKFNTDEKCFKYFMKVKYNNQFHCPYCSKRLYESEKLKEWELQKELNKQDTTSTDTINSNITTNTHINTTTTISNITNENAITDTKSYKKKIAEPRTKIWVADYQKPHPDSPLMKRYHRKDPETWKVIKKNNYVFICSKCKNQASPFKGTALHHTKISLQKWFLAMHMITSGKKWFAALQLHRELWVNYKTAFRMFHTIRNIMLDDMEKLDGIVEIDEAFITNQKKSPFSANKTKQGRSTENKSVIMALYSRKSKKIILRNVEKVDEKTTLWIIKKFVKVGARIMTDEWTSYANLRLHWYIHWTTNHKSWEYAKSFDIHSNMPETFWAFLKGWLGVVYQGVSEWWLDNYLNEFSWRFNNKDNVADLFDYVLKRV